jgi:hypothetical protein
MAFDLSGYQTVQERIDLLWTRYPNARYDIEIISLTDSQVVMRCRLWTDAADEHPRTVDFAEERVGTSNVNKVSHIENCATSVLGRCISGLGGEFSPKGKRPSREEMEKVARAKETPPPSDLNEQLAQINDVEKLQAFYETALASGWMSTEVRSKFTARKNELKAQEMGKS